MIVWNPEKNRVLYREDKDGKRVYPYGDDKKIIKPRAFVNDNNLTRAELVELAKESGVKNATRKKKEELMEELGLSGGEE